MDNVGLNKQLRQIRRFRNITQKRLGNAVGLSEAQICHLEKGNRKISSDLLFKLEDFLDIKFESNIDKKYTLKEIKKAMEKQFEWSEETMGIEIIKNADEGEWFKEMWESFKKKLKI